MRRPTAPVDAPTRSRPRIFTGWRVVAMAALLYGLSGPGQTAGVSVFVDPLIEGLQLSRSQVSTAYLVGTLTGALAMPRIGRVLDARGPRFTASVVGGLFAVVLAAMAGVQGLVTLAIGFIGIRMLGQGSMPLIATTSVAYWFDRKRGTAVGVVNAVGGSLLAMTPVVMALVVDEVGWRIGWLVTAVVVLVLAQPIARVGLIDRPADVGQRPDGDPTGDEHEPEAPMVGVRPEQARRTGMFWALAGGVITTGLIGTGMTFHQIDLLGQQGLTPLQAAAVFVPQTIAQLIATLSAGALLDRLPVRWLLVTAMGLLTASMLALPLVEPGVSVVLYAAGIGAGGGAARAMEGAGMPRLFGTLHVGAIRGQVMGLMVGATAFGPLALSLGRDLTGGYVSVLRLLVVLPAAVCVVALASRTPAPPAPAEADVAG